MLSVIELITKFVGASSLVRVLPSFVAAYLQLTKASVNNTVVSNTVNLEKRFIKSSYDFINLFLDRNKYHRSVPRLPVFRQVNLTCV